MCAILPDMKQKVTLEKLATTIEGLVRMVQKLPTKEYMRKAIHKAVEGSELRITKATLKGFESLEKGQAETNTRLDKLEKRVHGTELGINEIKVLHGKKIEALEEDMFLFRTALTRAKILTK